MNPSANQRRPVATLSLMGLLCVIHLIGPWIGTAPLRHLDFVAADPWRLHGLTFLTATVLHTSWLHLAGNVLGLYFYGVHAEHRLRWLRLLVLFFFAGAVGHASYALLFPASWRHSLGASGGVSGVMAFYSLLLRRDRVQSMLTRLRVPEPRRGWLSRLGLSSAKCKGPTVFHLLAVVLAWNAVGLVRQLAGLTRINAAAHLGGAMAGGLLYLVWRRKRKRTRGHRPGTTAALATLVPCALLVVVLTLVARRPPPLPLHDDQTLSLRQHATLELPIVFEAGLPTLRCRVNGREARLILDTGAMKFCVFQDSVARLGITAVARSRQGNTLGGPVTSFPVGTTVTAELGTGTVLTVDAPLILPAYPFEADGLLPWSALNAADARLDFQRNVLLLRK